MTEPVRPVRFWHLPLLYACLGAVWIYGSDWALLALEDTVPPATLRWMQTGKGIGYVLATSVLLYLLLRRSYGRLAVNQLQYHALFNDSPVARLVVDAQTGRVLEANRAAEDWYGFPLDALMTQTVSALHWCTRTDSPPVATALAEASDGEIGIWMRAEGIGSEAYASVFLQHLPFNGVQALHLVMIPITAQVQAERLANAKTAELGLFQENISDAFFAVDRDWRLMYVNAAFERIAQISRNELLGHNLWEAFPTSVGTPLHQHYLRAMERQESVHFETYYPAQDAWLNISVFPSPQGLWGFFEDITSEHRARQRVAEAERNYKAVINATEDSIWYIDRAGHILFHNASYARVRGDVLGKQDTIEHTLTPDKVPGACQEGQQKLWDEYAQAFTGQSRRFEYPLYDAEGRQRISEVSLNPVIGSNGEVVGIGCFSRDITERRAAEQRILEQNQRLRQIAWFQSHQVRGPVASILGLVMIFDRQQTNPANLEIIAHMESMANQLDRVIRTIVEEASEEKLV